MNQGINFDESFSLVASTKNIRIILCLGASQEKSVFVLDAMLPPFSLDYLRLHWPDHPELDAISQDPQLYALHNSRSMQGEKDDVHRWCQFLNGTLRNIGLHCNTTDHAVFTFTEPSAEMFIAIAMDYCLCFCNDRE
jgi:hypothetical protein